MKVLHLVKTSIGASWALSQISVLVGLGCEVHVLLPDEQGLAKTYQKVGACVHVMNVDIAAFLTRPIQLLKQIVNYRRLVKRISPDIVHSHFVGTTVFMRIAMFGMPIVKIFQVPGPLHLENKITRNLEIFLANKYDYWIPTCHLSAKLYLNHIHENRLKTIFYGIDLSLFHQSRTGILRKDLNIANNIKVIGIVAYTYPPKKWLGQKRGIKGHEDLIDAMEIVLKSHSDIVCVVVGGAWGNSENYFKQVVQYGHTKLGKHIIFLGTRNDVQHLYPDFDIAVHPSHSENLGGAAESLLMGIPTITTNVGGFPDLVKEQKTGWLVPKSNPKALADKIIYVLAHEKESRNIAKEGQKQTMSLIDVNHTAKQVYDFYCIILDVIKNKISLGNPNKI